MGSFGTGAGIGITFTFASVESRSSIVASTSVS
jgi:hypothetical protein